MRRLGGLAVQVGLSTAISIACVVLVVRAVDIGQVTAMLSKGTLGLGLAAIAAIVLDLLLRAWRWRLLVGPLTAVPVGRVMAYLLLGYLANNVLPARAGELVRSHYMGDREGASRVSVLGTVLVERVLDVVALLLLSALAWWLTGAAAPLAGLLLVGLGGGAAAIGIVAAVVALPGRDRLIPWLEARLPASVIAPTGRLRAGFAVVARPRILLGSAALTVAAWTVSSAVFAVAAAAIGFEISPAQVLLVAAATNLATAIPSAPGYVGTFEFAVVATAGAVGLGTAPALAMAVFVHVAILLTTTGGGLAAMYLVTYRGRLRLAHPLVAIDDLEEVAQRGDRSGLV